MVKCVGHISPRKYNHIIPQKLFASTNKTAGKYTVHSLKSPTFVNGRTVNK